MRAPLIAIVGRPNVGKSTLFNKIVGKKLAIVHDEPGVTRDRIYAEISINGMQYQLVDTGGYDPDAKEDILEEMKVQTELAIASADVIIFLLDGREGLLPLDKDIAERLRKTGKPLFFAVNKIDTRNHEKLLYEFYELGKDKLYPVSGEHNYGINSLLFAIAKEVRGPEEKKEKLKLPAIAIIGRPNVGKSSLVNQLLGEQRVLVRPEPGTTRDSIDSVVEFSGRHYLIIDTAGIRKKSKVHLSLERMAVLNAIRTIERAKIVLLMIDATEGVTEQEAKLAGLFLRRGKASIIVLNKWDLIEKPKIREKELMNLIYDRLWHISYSPTIPISAKTGFNIKNIFPLIDKVLASYSKRVQTAELNRAIERIFSETPPPHYRGRPLKLFYATQIKSAPPHFIFFVNYPEAVNEQFKRFVEKKIRDEFQFLGSPIILEFRKKRSH